MKHPLFIEVQRFRQWWIWGLLGLGLAFFGWGTYRQVFLGQQWGTNPAPDWGLWTVLVFIALIALFLFSLRLETRIDAVGIRYRFTPLLMRERRVLWDEVTKAFVRKYNPLFEYGGWGIRYGFRNGWAYNVSGCTGFQIELKSGKKILLGTQKKEALEKILKDLGRG